MKIKIKIKLIFIFVVIIFASSLPLSLFVIQIEKKEHIRLLYRQGEIYSRIIATATLHIFLMNGGEINPSEVDTQEIITILKPLEMEGLIYADAILLSNKDKYHGVILANFGDLIIHRAALGKAKPKRISQKEINRLVTQRGVHTVSIPGIKSECFEVVTVEALPRIPIDCIGRLIYEKDRVLRPFNRLKAVVFSATISIILVVGIIGYFFSGSLGRVFLKLTDELQHARESARLDPLTGVANARYFGELGQKELERCNRQQCALTIAYMDCDNFKNINDTYGHHTGDKVLIILAKVFKNHIRSIDTIARLGGDEFVILFPGLGNEIAVEVLKRIQYNTCGELKSCVANVTLSIGAVTFLSMRNNIMEMVKVADRLMYDAKHQGKNKIEYKIIA